MPPGSFAVWAELGSTPPSTSDRIVSQRSYKGRGHDLPNRLHAGGSLGEKSVPPNILSITEGESIPLIRYPSSVSHTLLILFALVDIGLVFRVGTGEIMFPRSVLSRHVKEIIMLLRIHRGLQSLFPRIGDRTGG